MSTLSQQVHEALKALLPDRMSTQRDLLDQHGQDESFHAPYSPDVVVYPVTNEEVSQIVQLCAQTRTPLIPFGAGTSLEGHIAATQGGICMDMSQMGQILEVNVDDLDCRVQAGVTRKQLNAALRHHGQFFPVDPGADATLGGMTSTRASGTNAVRYGTMKDNVLGLTVVMPDGKIVRTGSRARKSAAGYDLTRLFCGAEGTLGIITEVQLRCYGLPEAHAVGVCSFASIDAAVQTVIEVIQSGIPVARVELLDAAQMQAINQYSQLDYSAQPTLFFEFHGTSASVVEQSERVAELVQENHGSEFTWAVEQEAQNKLWQARHDAYYAARALRPGASGWPTDVCVPISRLADCIQQTQRDLVEFDLLAPIVGHVGDGNFHLLLLVDVDKPAELEIAKIVNDRLIKRALSMGGTCTGEHGIGYGKLAYMELEHGAAVAVMASIKRAIDPLNIMNPGKMIPDNVLKDEAQ
ncbi:MAG: FAD-linked oxidase C-terminal domain-containing protein [SAR86 cluster bacterium]|jgi:D-lactate dehydrogenase (cytochrome)|uniref:D-lactate dehydrogenase (cytochrome) n=1 Tax=SAR86 cluster bacterium TaxID=2030880 RepID=A0A972VYG7_9GAMM|nr:FAD-binding protein [SAR86 cluster bacterium]